MRSSERKYLMLAGAIKVPIVGLIRVPINSWMHSSVLGTCSGVTEDGEPRLHKDPKYGEDFGSSLPYGSHLTPLDMKGTWLKVRYVDAEGRTHEGWLPEQCFSLNEYGCP